MSKKTVGTCSLCQGPVVIPVVWHGAEPPIPTCSKCGATAKSHGPVIEMQKTQTHSKVILKDVNDKEGTILRG